ncbi:MAG: ribonuclease E/G [Proteobacteria bacterium]|nr:ribonuclease E/G [Pseudomonadota bacterium]
MAEIFYTVSPDLHRMARVEEGSVVELDFEIPNKPSSLLGSIYTGRVREIQKPLQAAFVDIGLSKPGILPLREGKLPHVKQGEAVLVQVTRTENPIEDKGVRLTRLITLALGSLLYTPFRPGLSLSKKLKNREMFKDLLHLSPEEGLIIRNWALPDDSLKETLAQLRSEWSEFLVKATQHPPTIVRSPLTLMERILRTLGASDSLLVDDRKMAQDITRFSREKAFDESCEEAWESILSAEIPLPQGGSLYIEETRGLTVIDINSSGALRQILPFNRIAIKEALRQIRLRNLGGKIVIDLISSFKESEPLLKGMVFPSDLEVWGISHMGLLELTRRRTGLSLPQRLKLQLN